MPILRRPFLLCAFAAVAATMACDGLFNPACTLELGWELSPSARTLTVGESLTPRGTIVSLR